MNETHTRIDISSLPIEPLLNWAEASRILGLTVSTLKDWVWKKKIGYVKNGKQIMFEPEVLRQHIAAGRVPAKKEYIQ